MADDAGRPSLNISAVTRKGKRWTLAMRSSRAEKVAKPRRPIAVDVSILAKSRRMQASRPSGRRGVGMDGEHLRAIQAVGTIGVTERTMGATGRMRGASGI